MNEQPWTMTRARYTQFVFTRLSIPWWTEGEHYIANRTVGTDNYYDALADGYCRYMGYVPRDKCI